MAACPSRVVRSVREAIMRHRKQGRKLGRTKSHREAMFRNLVVSLFEHERVETTDAKAKELGYDP